MEIITLVEVEDKIIITLDNKDFLIIDKVNYENKNYLYV